MAGRRPTVATAAPTVRVELDEHDGGDLLEALSVRGFGTRVVSDGEGFAVDVEAPPGEEGVWNLELVAALETWLEETDRRSVVARLGRTAYTVRAPGAAPPDPPFDPRPERRLGVGVIVAALAAVVLAAAAVWLLVAAALQAV